MKTLESVTGLLRSTPSILKTWATEVPEFLWHSREHSGSWNPVDVLKHLIHGEETDWIPRLHQMIDGSGKGESVKFTPYDMNGYQNIQGNYQELAGVFEFRRYENVEELGRILRDHDLGSLKAQHPELGVVTGSDLVHAWGAHDLTHIYQISRNFAVPLLEQAGPWPIYLRIAGLKGGQGE